MNTQPTQLTRRDALKTLGASAALIGLNLLAPRLPAAPSASSEKITDIYPFALPPLGYAFNALEPHIDARTMEIHYTKHHQAYITNANAALATQPTLQNLPIAPLLSRINTTAIPEPLRTTLRNNIGGHANHTFFWQILAPNAGATAPTGKLAADITATFGGFGALKTQFTAAALSRFGSGWAWLVHSRATGKLAITTSANQDSPLLSNDIPVLALDIWEHAYYLKYQNRRADYIAAFWNIVNWPRCDAIYAAART